MILDLVRNNIEREIDDLKDSRAGISHKYQRDMKRISREIQKLRDNYKQLESFFGSDAIDPKDIAKLNVPSYKAVISTRETLIAPSFTGYYIDIIRDVYYSLIQLYGYQDKLISADLCYLFPCLHDHSQDILRLYYFWIKGTIEELEKIKKIAGNDLEQYVHVFLNRQKSLFGNKYQLNNDKYFELTCSHDNEKWSFYGARKIDYRLSKHKLYNGSILINPTSYDETINLNNFDFSKSKDEFCSYTNYSKYGSVKEDFLRDFLYRMMLYCRNNYIVKPLDRVEMEEFYKAMYGEDLMSDPSRVDKRKVKTHIEG